jgi:hypothetical protein
MFNYVPNDPPAMLRVVDRAQAGSQRLHGQADLTGRSPSLNRLRRRLLRGIKRISLGEGGTFLNPS